jgi:osmoprotectant transport system substrate-binding protein
MNRLLTGAIVLTLAGVLAGCGGTSTSAAGGSTDKAAGATTVNLKGETFTMGTKGFTEHAILTQITKLMLEKAGANVTIRDLPSTQQVRAALKSGDLDMYWEYTGTAWTNFLSHEKADTTDPQELYKKVAAEDLAKNGVQWLPPAPLNDTYGIAVRSEAAGRLKVEKSSDLVKLAKTSPKDLTMCGDETWTDRPDNLPALEKTYGFTVPRGNIRISDYSLIFQAVDKGSPCNFGAIYQTDGRLQALGLKVLTDDKGAFLSYLPALTMSKERYAKVGPRVEALIKPLLSSLDTETITKLNGQVDVKGDFPEDVAKQWLQDKGLL